MSSPAKTLCLLLTCTLLVVAVPAPAQDSTYDMEFRNTEIDDILRVLADHYQINVAINGDIGESVTVNLKGLSIEEALDVLLEGSRWTWRLEGAQEEIYRVLPLSTATTEIFTLSFTDAATLAQVITAQVQGITVNAEEHSNSLLVSGPLEAVREVAWLVASVDRYRERVPVTAALA
jgi:type II secretory pathway component GspD/PulD (secretin)